MKPSDSDDKRPCLSIGTIFDSPLFVTDGMAKIGFPRPSVPRAAPLMKSIWPPTPADKKTG